jgi:hypothetical protein
VSRCFCCRHLSGTWMETQSMASKCLVARLVNIFQALDVCLIFFHMRLQFESTTRGNRTERKSGKMNLEIASLRFPVPHSTPWQSKTHKTRRTTDPFHTQSIQTYDYSFHQSFSIAQVDGCVPMLSSSGPKFVCASSSCPKVWRRVRVCARLDSSQ